MSTSISNPCSRCGKARIIARTWVEEVDTFYGKSKLTHTETVCPDEDCQKIVAEKNETARLKKVELDQQREERMKRSQQNAHKVRQ